MQVVAQMDVREVRIVFVVSEAEHAHIRAYIEPQPRARIGLYHCEKKFKRHCVAIPDLWSSLAAWHFRPTRVEYSLLKTNECTEMSPGSLEKRAALLTYVFEQWKAPLVDPKLIGVYDYFAARIWDVVRVRKYTLDDHRFVLMQFSEPSKLMASKEVEDSLAEKWGMVRVEADTPRTLQKKAELAAQTAEVEK